MRFLDWPGLCPTCGQPDGWHDDDLHVVARALVPRHLTRPPGREAFRSWLISERMTDPNWARWNMPIPEDVPAVEPREPALELLDWLLVAATVMAAAAYVLVPLDPFLVAAGLATAMFAGRLTKES